MQWFVDETKARGYVIAAPLVEDADVTAARRTLRASDAVAWAFARGGVWREMAADVVLAECHV